MSKSEVKILIGSPLYVTKIPESKAEDGSEFWEYEWTHAIIYPNPANEAYVVYFNKEGKVTSFRKPLEKKE